MPSLFVKGLSKTQTPSQLHQTLGPSLGIVDVQIAKHRSGRSAGFAIVSFATQQAAAAALSALDGSLLQGRRLNVRWYSPGAEGMQHFEGAPVAGGAAAGGAPAAAPPVAASLLNLPPWDIQCGLGPLPAFPPPPTLAGPPTDGLLQAAQAQQQAQVQQQQAAQVQQRQAQQQVTQAQQQEQAQQQQQQTRQQEQQQDGGQEQEALPATPVAQRSLSRSHSEELLPTFVGADGSAGWTNLIGMWFDSGSGNAPNQTPPPRADFKLDPVQALTPLLARPFDDLTPGHVQRRWRTPVSQMAVSLTVEGLDLEGLPPKSSSGKKAEDPGSFGKSRLLTKWGVSLHSRFADEGGPQPPPPAPAPAAVPCGVAGGGAGAATPAAQPQQAGGGSGPAAAPGGPARASSLSSVAVPFFAPAARPPPSQQQPPRQHGQGQQGEQQQGAGGAGGGPQHQRALSLDAAPWQEDGVARSMHAQQAVQQAKQQQAQQAAQQQAEQQQQVAQQQVAQQQQRAAACSSTPDATPASDQAQRQAPAKAQQQQQQPQQQGGAPKAPAAKAAGVDQALRPPMGAVQQAKVALQGRDVGAGGGGQNHLAQQAQAQAQQHHHHLQQQARPPLAGTMHPAHQLTAAQQQYSAALAQMEAARAQMLVASAALGHDPAYNPAYAHDPAYNPAYAHDAAFMAHGGLYPPHPHMVPPAAGMGGLHPGVMMHPAGMGGHGYYSYHGYH